MPTSNIYIYIVSSAEKNDLLFLKIGVSTVFEIVFSLSYWPRLHLFNQKYSKNTNNIKYFYN